VVLAIAEEEGFEFGECHRDLINFLRDDCINNGGNQPITRSRVKAMSKTWNDRPVNVKNRYDLFAGDPGKRGGRIADLPESRRKSGY
jgi:tRNA 2-thiouridine synthesizing protein E